MREFVGRENPLRFSLLFVYVISKNMTICHIWKVFRELTKENGCQGIDKSGHNGRSYDGRGIHTAVLFSISKDANGNELQGGNVDD